MSWRGVSNESTIEKSLGEKLPKLQAFTADRKILLLEQQAVAGSVSKDLGSYFERRGYAWLPDEIWLMHTAALETERYVHVSQQHPFPNYIKADWKDGKIDVGNLAAE